MPSFSTLKRTSAASGLVFGVFLAYHLYCHYCLYWKGYDAANHALIQGRVIYQNPLVEVLLAVSVLVHMYANTALYLYRTKENKASSAELKAHRMAGYFMGLSIVGHVGATRLAPLYILDGDASVYNYGFVHAAAHHLGGAPFYLYLIIFAMAGGWHLIYGTRSALATLLGTSVVANNKPIMPIPLKVMALTNHVFIILGVLALSGCFYTIHISREQVVEQDKLFTTIGLA